MRTLPRQRAPLGESRFKLRLTVVRLAPPMRTPGRIKRSDFPKDELLTRLSDVAGNSVTLGGRSAQLWNKLVSYVRT